MEFEWVAIALGDVAWISLAFVFGFLASQIGLPPLIGFLVTGFVLSFFGSTGSDVLNKLADLGITLLLFTVGLKLNLRQLIKPQVWAVTAIHSTTVTIVAGMLVFWSAVLGLPLFADLDLRAALTIGFALSFSSTVFTVSALGRAGEMNALHGSIAIGVLIMQDLAAVVFLAASTGKFPSPWAASLILLVFLRPLLLRLLRGAGHEELLVLYGLVLALGGAELFELAQVKGDLGALFLGVLVAGHPKSDELAKVMFGFKNLFLVGFFLSIGLTGQPTLGAVLVGLALTPLIFAKSALYFALMTRFRLRARTSLLASLQLTNFSEFGLIVAAIGVSNGWLDDAWLTAIAVALSLSFVIVSPLVEIDDRIYGRLRGFWTRFQRPERLPDDQILDLRTANYAVFGMGRVGTGAYEELRASHGTSTIGIDFDPAVVAAHQTAGRNVLQGDPSDADFWEKVEHTHSIDTVLLALPNLRANLDALEQLRGVDFSGRIVALAKFATDERALLDNGATDVFNIYKEAGAGFANHAMSADTALTGTK
ncbi:MAG: cation:proton antiporter [Maritimibacter sp.]|nr:cation:proton antiporter [Maritimibacter sp.]